MPFGLQPYALLAEQCVLSHKNIEVRTVEKHDVSQVLARLQCRAVLFSMMLSTCVNVTYVDGFAGEHSTLLNTVFLNTKHR